MKSIRVFIAALFCLLAFSMSAQSEHTISLAGQTGDTISRTIITSNPVVMVAGTDISVTSFGFSYLNENGALITLAIKDKYLNSPALTVLANPIVKKIYIENVLFMMNGILMMAQPKTINLRD